MQKSKWLRLCVCECACEKYSVKKHLDRRRILCQLRLTQRYATHTHTDILTLVSHLFGNAGVVSFVHSTLF